MSITSYPEVVTLGGGVGDYPYPLQVSRGLVPDHKRIFKFGYNGTVQNVEETVWETGGIYAHPTSAVAMTVTSASGASDNGVQVTVSGLDSNYYEVSETVTLTGSGTATTTQTFLRANRAFVSGSTEPAGAISITNGGITYVYINGDNQSLMSVWTVPADYTAYLLQFDVSAFTEQNNKVATIRWVTRAFGGVYRTQNIFDLFQSSISQGITAPEPILEKTDIEFRAIASGSNADLRISAAFDIIYIKNTAP